MQQLYAELSYAYLVTAQPWQLLGTEIVQWGAAENSDNETSAYLLQREEKE